jgi:hypothetical protein
MNPKEEDYPALYEWESAVLALWKRRPELTDYSVERGYAAAMDGYRARVRGEEPRPVKLAGLDLEAYTVVREVGDRLLSEGATSGKMPRSRNAGPVPIEKAVDYLRELTRSVRRHTKAGGGRGYLEFLKEFVP